MELKFFVPGIPAPQGSKRHVGKGVMVESSKAVGPWRERVALIAAETMNGDAPLDKPLGLRAEFYFPRPRSHYRTGRFSHLLRHDRPEFVRSRPDIEKLVRAVNDALTGVAFRDDSLVVWMQTYKKYASTPGAQITLFAAEE